MNVRIEKKRVAMAEIMGTLIMVAITLIAGTAVFGWINGQAGSSENAYGQSVASNVNFLRESFSVVATQVLGCSGDANGDPCTSLSLTLYNRGEVSLNVSSITIATLPGANSSWSLTFGASILTGSCPIPAIVPNQKVAGNLLPVSALSSPPYQPYQVTIPGCWGNDMLVGQSYVVTIQGVYSNVIQTQIRASE